MLPSDFDSAFALVQSSGYFIIFLIMVLEGPIITSAAAFASSLGLFNIWIIFFLSLLADLIGDFLHYTIGWMTRRAVIERFEKRKGFSAEKINFLERNLKKHFGKTIFMIKFTPPLTSAGLLLTGALKIDLKKFAFYSFIITLPRTIFFTAIGYYLGFALNSYLRYLKIGQYLIPIAIVMGIIVYFVYRFIAKRIEEKSKKGFHNLHF